MPFAILRSRLSSLVLLPERHQAREPHHDGRKWSPAGAERRTTGEAPPPGTAQTLGDYSSDVEVSWRHLVEGVPISNLCDERCLQPTAFCRWQKEFFARWPPSEI